MILGSKKLNTQRKKPWSWSKRLKEEDTGTANPAAGVWQLRGREGLIFVE